MTLSVVEKLKKNQFLFEELVKRDFKTKYKGTLLGVGWSLLSPLLMLLVMAMIFTTFFGRDTPHYVIYMFSGLICYNFFSDATKSGMTSIVGNAGIFTKVNVPKYLFLLAKNVQTFINFLLILIVYFIFVAFDRELHFTWKFLLLLWPIGCELLFNIGMSMILSALFVFFRDLKYLYDVLVRLIMYMCAIFYNVDKFSPRAQQLFLLNPVYLCIRYFRMIVIENTIPSPFFHLRMLVWVVVVLSLGSRLYRYYNSKFLYYL